MSHVHLLCLMHVFPCFSSDMCYRLLARYSDDDTVQSLVLSTFESMWFSATNPIIAERGGMRHGTTYSNEFKGLVKKIMETIGIAHRDGKGTTLVRRSCVSMGRNMT